jgi:hypothetical protein
MVMPMETLEQVTAPMHLQELSTKSTRCSSPAKTSMCSPRKKQVVEKGHLSTIQMIFLAVPGRCCLKVDAQDVSCASLYI